MPCVTVSKSLLYNYVLPVSLSIGTCSCLMKQPGQNLPSGIMVPKYYVFVTHVNNDSVAAYTSLEPGNRTTLTGLQPESNYNVKFMIFYNNNWFEVKSNGEEHTYVCVCVCVCVFMRARASERVCCVCVYLCMCMSC